MKTVNITNEYGFVFVQVLFFAAMGIVIATIALTYVFNGIKEQQLNATKAMAELQLTIVQAALGSRPVLHSTAKMESAVTGLGTVPTLLNCAKQKAMELNLTTDLISTGPCNPVGTPTDVLLYVESSVLPLYPNPNAAANACVLDRTATPCNCGSTPQCRWKIKVNYIVNGAYDQVTMAAQVLYVPGGQVPTLPIAPREASLKIAMNSFSAAADSRQKCNLQSESLKGYTNEFGPVCAITTKACPSGYFPNGIKGDGGFDCKKFN